MSQHTRPFVVDPPPARPAPSTLLSPEQLAHLVEVLEHSRRSVDVPALVVLAATSDGSSEPALDLAVTPVEGDPRAWLTGFVVDPSWSAVALVTTGTTVPVDGGDPGTAREPVSIAYACGRDRTCAVCVRMGDGEPAVQVTGPGGRPMPSGRLVDLLWRALRLPTTPPGGGPADLAVDLWLHRVLVEVTATGPGHSAPSRRDLDRLVPHLPDSWEELRLERIRGGWPELGIHPDLAEWMDTGAFARACLEVFAERDDVLGTLAEVLDPAAWHHLIGRLGQRPGPD